MEETQNVRALPAAEGDSVEPIALSVDVGARRFAAFLICLALLVAAFAVTALFVRRDTDGLSGKLHGLFHGETAEEGGSSDGREPSPKNPESLPEGATPVINRDLSYLELGESYLHNETPYTPDLSVLLERALPRLSATDAPQILILHTHTSESYQEGEPSYLAGSPGDTTYSRDADRSVIAVGKALAETLQEKGITVIHCTVMHDAPTLGGSYERSAEAVKKYVEQYPTIVLVIDLHRDAILNASGEYIRPQGSASSAAQVMAVVGSDCNGTRHERWEENLALAVQLRAKLNQTTPDLCRPVSLRNASYNQELAPYYLLLEIGSGASSVKEACASAVLVGQGLAELLQER